MSEDPDWESNPGRPNGYQKKGRGENFMLPRAFLRAGGFFLVLGRLLEKN